MAEKGIYTYDYPRPAFCVDSVVFRVSKDLKSLEVLLIERGEDPFLGSLALPGGHVEMEEDLPEACSRELLEETALVVSPSSWREVGTYGAPGRDPRGRVISTAFWDLLGTGSRHRVVRPGSDASDARWCAIPVRDDLAFDHDRILHEALWNLQNTAQTTSLVFYKVLPEKFTMRDLQTAMETLQRQKLDKRNFQAQVKKHPCIRKVPGEFWLEHKHRPAQYHTHDWICTNKHNLG